IAEDRSDPVTTVLDASKRSPVYTVTVETSHYPVVLVIDGASKNLAPDLRPGTGGPMSKFFVYWTASNSQAAPVTVTWTAHATIQGECPGAAACAVPAGQVVRVVSITQEPDAP